MTKQWEIKTIFLCLGSNLQTGKIINKAGKESSRLYIENNCILAPEGIKSNCQGLFETGCSLF